MANFVRSESVVSVDWSRNDEVIEVPRCYYTRWAGDEDNVKEDLIILENLYPQVRKITCSSRVSFILADPYHAIRNHLYSSMTVHSVHPFDAMLVI